MLVIARKKGESVCLKIGGKLVKVNIVEISSHRVRLGFEADRDVIINREEVQLAQDAARKGGAS